MPPKKPSTSKNEESSKQKIVDDVMSKVFSRMNKSPSKRRKVVKKSRKFGDLPNSDDSFDDSSDSDYEPSTNKKRILNESKSTKPKIVQAKTKPKISSTRSSNFRSNKFVEYSSSDDENKPSSSVKLCSRKIPSKKILPQRSAKIKFATNSIVHSGGTSDAGSTTSSVVCVSKTKKSAVDYLSRKNFAKSLKRPSLKRFRSSSFSENLESLANTDEPPTITTTTTTMTLPSHQKATKNLKSAEKLEPYVGNNMWGEKIPVEVLSNVFRFAMLAEGGAVPFLSKIQLVCRLWHNVARMPMLWTDIDVDFQKKIKDSKMALAYLSNYIEFTKSLSFSRWSKLKIPELDNLLQCNSKCIRSLDVSFCCSLSPKQLLEHSLPTYCPNLQSLNLSYFCTVNTSLTNSLKTYLLANGEHLRCLYLNGNTVQRFHKFCETFKNSNSMRNLQVLDISRLVCQTVQSHRISILDFCQAFPNLTHLYMSDAIVGFNVTSDIDFENTEEIWPNLIHFEFAVKEPWWGFWNNFQNLMKCLQKCLNLRRLCISGNRIGQNLDLLANIPLTEVDISRTSDISMSIGETMKKWAASLEVLDISWIKCCDVLPEICKLLTPPKAAPPPPLRRLNVAGTPITVERLK